MPGKTFWQDGGAMKTRKERTSRGYLERSSKAVYKQLPHSENMTIKKELAFFINAIIPPRPKCYLWVTFPGIEFFETKLKFKGREKKSSLCAGLTSSKKRRIKKFHVVVVQWRQRNVQKNKDHKRLIINQIAFLSLSSPSPSSSLNLSLFTDKWRNVVNGRLVLVSILDKLLRYLQYYSGFWLVILNVSSNNQAFCISWSRDQLPVSTKTVRFWKILFERAERAY